MLQFQKNKNITQSTLRVAPPARVPSQKISSMRSCSKIEPILSKRRSLRSEIELKGLAVHSGKQVRLRLCPQQSGKGIIFLRTDLKDEMGAPQSFTARYDKVIDTRLCTTIGNEQGGHISTIEHLMAAFAGCGIDDVLVEIDNAEVPVMDGSSQIFVEAIAQAGIVELDSIRDYIHIAKKVEVKQKDGWASLSPSSQFEMSVTIDFPNEVIGRQNFSTQGESEAWMGDFQDKMASARTFGFIEDLDHLRKMGLAQGSSLDNTIAIEKDKSDGRKGRILNERGLRFDNEFARHKALDALGDLALAGAPLIGRFESYKGGHGLNNQLLRALFADPSAYY